MYVHVGLRVSLAVHPHCDSVLVHYRAALAGLAASLSLRPHCPCTVPYCTVPYRVLARAARGRAPRGLTGVLVTHCGFICRCRTHGSAGIYGLLTHNATQWYISNICIVIFYFSFLISYVYNFCLGSTRSCSVRERGCDCLVVSLALSGLRTLSVLDSHDIVRTTKR